MKRWKTLLAGTFFCLLFLTGCGNKYEAETSTVFVLKSGEIVSTDVEAFDEATYDRAGLETYVKSEVENYVNENGKEAVKLKEMKVEDQKAVLTMEYASPEDYSKFTGIELFSGSIIEALSRGYSFDMDFAAIDGEKVTACKVEDFLGNSDYKVVIIKGNVNVCVPGTILYASERNAAIVDKSTIAIAEGNSLLQQDMEDSQGVQPTEALPVETETQGMTEAEAVDEDDLLSLEENSTEPVFHFDDDTQESQEMQQEFSDIYNYIIFK